MTLLNRFISFASPGTDQVSNRHSDMFANLRVGTLQMVKAACYTRKPVSVSFEKQDHVMRQNPDTSMIDFWSRIALDITSAGL